MLKLWVLLLILLMAQLWQIFWHSWSRNRSHMPSFCWVSTETRVDVLKGLASWLHTFSAATEVLQTLEMLHTSLVVRKATGLGNLRLRVWTFKIGPGWDFRDTHGLHGKLYPHDHPASANQINLCILVADNVLPYWFIPLYLTIMFPRMFPMCIESRKILHRSAHCLTASPSLSKLPC